MPSRRRPRGTLVDRCVASETRGELAPDPNGQVTEVAPVVGSEPAAGDPRGSGAAGRIARGMAANMGGIGVTLIIQLISVPVLLAGWGVPVYGEWLVLSAIPTYVALSDMSFSSVAGNSMVMLVSQDKRADAVVLGRRLWSIVTVTTAFAVLAAVAVALVFSGAFGNGAAIPDSEVRVVLVALFLQVAVGNQYGVLDAWYRAGGHYPLSISLRQLGRMLEFGALAGSVILGAQPGFAAISFLVASVVGFGVSWLVLRRVVTWSSFRPERPHLQTVRELLAPGIAFMSFPISNALSLQGLTIVIGATLGASAVVTFSTTRTITRLALHAMASINNSIWPELSRSVGGGHLGEARAILRRSVQVSLALSCSLVLILALFGVQIILWWTHQLVDPPELLLYILLLVIVANSAWYTLSAVLIATNRHRRLAVLYLSGTVTALLAAVPLSSAYGLPGAAVALLAIDVAMVSYVFPAALHVVQDKPSDFLRALLDVRGAVRLAISSVVPSK
jgi:O-antigen/teichoic acid export membrane protein